MRRFPTFGAHRDASLIAHEATARMQFARDVSAGIPEWPVNLAGYLVTPAGRFVPEPGGAYGGPAAGVWPRAAVRWTAELATPIRREPPAHASGSTRRPEPSAGVPGP
ncbi:hypothetical protein GCM10010211_10900 [Streptomyces albospinus]|uniref:Uncharacterized protein n=1 Tax=Streptomyces albospinus TaxID=285515 RepID=A0ABQ2US30_9ACTN|nr:hypothetical protein GCM10010211_10900 [Streptomyces albospinus]